MAPDKDLIDVPKEHFRCLERAEVLDSWRICQGYYRLLNNFTHSYGRQKKVCSKWGKKITITIRAET